MDEFRLEYPRAERKQASVLVVEPDEGARYQFQDELIALGFGKISLASDHGAGLARLIERSFSHVLFPTIDTTMSAVDFLAAVLKDDPRTVCIAVSLEPDTEELFDFLMLGVKGYLIMPWQPEMLEEVMAEATKGVPVPQSLLRATDRSEALISALANDLDKCARVLKRYGNDDSLVADHAAQASFMLKRSVQRVLAFTKGGEEVYLKKLESFLIERGKGPASRLGRLRKQLERERLKESDTED